MINRRFDGFDWDAGNSAKWHAKQLMPTIQESALSNARIFRIGNVIIFIRNSGFISNRFQKAAGSRGLRNVEEVFCKTLVGF